MSFVLSPDGVEEPLALGADGYDHTPPAVNLKCIAFSAALAGGYWLLPARNKWVLASLVYLPYLILAWYDFVYTCQHNFGPTYLAHFYAWGKPQRSRQVQIYKNWAPEYKNRVLMVDAAVGVALLATLPAFIKWQPEKQTPEQEATAEKGALVALGALVFLLGYLRFKLGNGSATSSSMSGGKRALLGLAYA